MSRSQAYASVEATVSALQLALHEDLLAVYLYGSMSDGTYQAGQSDVNLIAIHRNSSDLHLVRRALCGQLWSTHGPVLRQTPLFATRDTFNRHLMLNPLLHQHVVQSAQLLFGQPLALEAIATPSKGESIANAAAQAIQATAALAPTLLPVKEADEALRSLRSLARRLFGWPVDADESPAVLAGRVLGHLRKSLDGAEIDLWPDQVVPNAPPLISDLRAIFERDNHLILVMPDLEPIELARRIASTNWDQVASRITDQYRGLHVATPSLLRLAVAFEDSADYLIQSYHHAWGADVIDNLDIVHANAFRAMAQQPSELELCGLPFAYVTAEDADLSMLVHDFQNKLLNIQLRSELLCRTIDTPGSVPPESLPERDAPDAVRIDAIFSHLHWWAGHYAGLFQGALAKSQIEE